MATMSVTPWVSLLQDSLQFIHIKNALNGSSYWKGYAGKGVALIFACFLSGQMVNAQNFRTLRDVKVQETVLDLSQTDCKVIPRNAMHSCHRLTSLTLPPKLDSIGTQAFFACDGISGKLHFPATTRVVDASAFNGCRPACADNAFDGIDLSRVKLIFPAKAKKAYRNTPGWRNFFSRHEMENVCDPENLLVPRPLKLEVYKNSLPLEWKDVVGVEGPQELSNEKMQAERILGERTAYKKGRKIGPMVRLALDKSLTNDEAYTLQVNDKGVTIKGRTATGVFYGLMTLEQLCVGNGVSLRSVKIPALNIADEPRTAIRELMVDPVRHFIPFDDLKGFVVEMARYKFNALHLHLVDDQAWRIEIKKFPELIEKAADRVGMDDMPERISGYYTQDQMRELVRFAAQYHVMVIPEIELPGHEVAAVHCFPQLSCAKKPVPIRLTCGVSNELLCPAEPFVYEFLDNVLTELADVFPAPYVHLGGDEAGQPPLGAWTDCAACTALKKKEGYTENWQLQQYLFDLVIHKLQSLGKTPMYWYEQEFKTIQPGCVVYAWRHGLTKTAIDAAVRNKAKIMLCPGEHCYLDYPQNRGDMPEKNWGMPVTTLEQTYRLDPAWGQDSVFVRDNLLGVSGTLWSECINSTERIYYQAFPRAAALAEAGWSVPERRSYKEFLKRVRPLTDDMQRRGVAVNVRQILIDALRAVK